MRSQIKVLVNVMAAGAIIIAAPAAWAQSADPQPTTALAAAADPAQTPTPPIPTVQPTLAAPTWTANAGFEGDTNGTGYAFAGPMYVHPVSRNVGWLAAA